MATRYFRIFSRTLIIGIFGFLVVLFYTEQIKKKRIVPYDDRLHQLEEEFKSKPLLFDLAKVSDPPDAMRSLVQENPGSWWQRWLPDKACSPPSPSSLKSSRALVSADRRLLVCDVNPRTTRLWKHMSAAGDMMKLGELAESEMNRVYTSNSTRRILVTRNPFSQVMAVYVDTLYLPNVLGWQRHGAPAIKASDAEWRQRQQHLSQDPCYHDTTFSEFVAYLLQDNQTAPELLSQIRDQCDSCSSRYHIILRHETLSQTLLNRSGSVDTQQMWAVADREQIWEDIQRYQAVRARVSKCLSPYEAMQKLWKSWQIFGILDVWAKFPFSSPDEAEKATPEQLRNLAEKAALTKKSNTEGGRFANEMLALKEAFAEVTLKVKLKLEFLLRDVSESRGYKPDPYFLYLTNGVFFREDQLSLFSIQFA